MEYKAVKILIGVGALGLMLAIPSMAPAYDVGEADAMRTLGEGYNYRPPSTWRGSGGHNESGGPIMMDQYLTPPKKRQSPDRQPERDGDTTPGDNVREGDTR